MTAVHPALLIIEYPASYQWLLYNFVVLCYTAALYEKYDEAKQLEKQSPFEFDAYLTSLEALMKDQEGRGSAMSFFAKLLKPLRDQMKASGDTLPEDRRQMVAKAQRAWEATLKKGRPNQDQLTKQRQRSRSPRHKSHSRRNYRDRSRSRHRHKSHRDRESHQDRESHRDHHKDRYERKDRDRKDRREDRSRQDSKDQLTKGRCYSCGEPGHYSANCPKKQKRVHAIRHRSHSRSLSSSSASSRARTLSPSPSTSSKN